MTLEILPVNYFQRSAKGVENEPMLQPLTGETLKYQTAKTEQYKIGCECFRFLVP